MLGLLCLLLLFSAMLHAVTWSYYDKDNRKLDNPTSKEIEEFAVMRSNDAGDMQFVLDIKHDFSGTWGIGYLDNIGNAAPPSGKQWVTKDEEIICAVDGIVQNVYNMDSRYITKGYFASGAPNSSGDIDYALKFDGVDDYIETSDPIILSTQYFDFITSSFQSYGFTIQFWLKRDRLDVEEYLFYLVEPFLSRGFFQVGFDTDNKLIIRISDVFKNKGVYKSKNSIDSGWHQWKIRVEETEVDKCKEVLSPNSPCFDKCLPFTGLSIKAIADGTVVLDEMFSDDVLYNIRPRYNGDQVVDCYFVSLPLFHLVNKLIIGKSDIGEHFNGLLRNFSIYEGNNTEKIILAFNFSDKNMSNILYSLDNPSNKYGQLVNFDINTCWRVLDHNKIKRYYTFDTVQPLQKVHSFKMTKPATLIYDWEIQYAVSINTLPGGMKAFPRILLENTGTSYKGSGKYWFNNGSKLFLTSEDSDCLGVNGYKNLNTNEMIYEKSLTIDNLNSPQMIRWVYTPYLFSETVTLGSPVLFNTIPPDILKRIDTDQKPKYISTHILEENMMTWSESEKRIYPLRGGETFELEYDIKGVACEDIKAIVKISTQWPQYAHVTHIANTPPVNLDPSPIDDVVFKGLYQSKDVSTIFDNAFIATKRGNSVLLFKRNYINDSAPKDISLQFNGNGYIEINNPGLYNSFTIEFWANRAQNIGDGVIISQGNGETHELAIGFTQDNKAFFSISYQTLESNVSEDDNNAWHHYAFVYETITLQENTNQHFSCENNSEKFDTCKYYDPNYVTSGYEAGSTVNNGITHYDPFMTIHRSRADVIEFKKLIYRDGILIASDETPVSSLYNGINSIRIGANSIATPQYQNYKGKLDEIRFWNKALTAQEIYTQKDNVLQGNENGLSHYYKIDRIGSSFILDSIVLNDVWNIGNLIQMDPSNSWVVEPTNEYALNPREIILKGNTCVRVVNTQLETEQKNEDIAYVGHEITSTYHDNAVPHNGYVFFDKVPYNKKIYDRKSLKAPIYPVNSHHPANDGRDKILVIWYHKQDGISWPYKPVDYECKWPQDSYRIVISSQLGSEGKDANGKDQTYADDNDSEQNYFDTIRYSDIMIYNQPNPNLPGYNPNEEHAIAALSYRNSSMAPQPTAAYALRNDLNRIVPGDDYTSEPFVLVQLFDKKANRQIMIPYKVIKVDHSCNYYFNYYMKAGDPVVPPFPLNDIIGSNPPVETFGFNISKTKNCYWKDYTGQAWAISGSGDPLVIESIVLQSSTKHQTSYDLRLQSQTLRYGHYYSVKVTDNRGIVGYTKFRSGIFDSNNKNAAVYVDSSSIANYSDNIIVYLQPGIDHLKSSNFKIFHYDDNFQLISYFWYPLKPSFWLDDKTPGDGTGEVGKSIAWLPDGIIQSFHNFPAHMLSKDKAVAVNYNVVWPEDVPVLKAGESLTFAGGEFRADNPDSPGLPEVLGWASGQVVYDFVIPSMNQLQIVKNYSVRLAQVLMERSVDLYAEHYPDGLKPASGRVDIKNNCWFFKELHAGLKKRLFYDPTIQKLIFKGFVNDKTLGDSTLTASPPAIFTLQPDIMTNREFQTIKKIQGTNSHFIAAVDTLYKLTHDPNHLSSIKNNFVGLEFYKDQLSAMIEKHSSHKKFFEDMYAAWLDNIYDNRVVPQISFGPGLALIPNPDFMDPEALPYSSIDQGYVTLAENNHPDMEGLPVKLHIIKVVKDGVRSAIKMVYSDNVFDEKLTLRHSADFGGNAENLVFEWRYREVDGIYVQTPDKSPDQWLVFSDTSNNNGLGMNEICLAKTGAVLLVDNLFYVRYRHKNRDPSDPLSWSDWAGAANSKPGDYQAQLAKGWVKRVFNAVNPFEARVKEFYNIDSPATYVSMISQAGARYEDAVALNPDKDVIENMGLIELYQTVMNRAMDLSINLEQPVTTPGVMNALLYAATRIADFYRLLGNEAYNDALDPTIGFGSDSIEYGSLAPTIFCFENQVQSLLDEELSLLRGMPDKGVRPVYNRLMWNFTRAEGEVAYAMSYYMTDKNKDGLIDIDDARILYPQGHGDAWGHYLTAMKVYYDLLGHPNFNWNPRSEKLSIQGVVIDVDYFDERKFAETAASKARTGNDIVSLTYRSEYVENPDGQWLGYQDTDKNRDWGLEGWSRRAFTGSYFDWLIANAVLPSEDTENTGIKKIDRKTTKDIMEIASQARQIENQYESANKGLNPLGLASDMIPFDIDPARLVPEHPNVATQFEQVYERAEKAMKNAQMIFDHANDLKNRIRQNAVSSEDFAKQVYEKDMAYRNQLIEIFGTPYEGKIGTGKAYPSGYQGPDYYFYHYIDVNEVTNKSVDKPDKNIRAYFNANIVKTYNVKLTPDNAAYNETTINYSRFFKSDMTLNSNVDLSSQLTIDLPITTDLYAFNAPDNWGLRRSPGKIQQALMELLQSEIYLKISLSDYNDLLNNIKAGLEIMKARYDLNQEELSIGTWAQQNVKNINNSIEYWNTMKNFYEVSGESLWNFAQAFCEGLPTSVGLATDPSFGIRGYILTSAQILQTSSQFFGVLANSTVDKLEAKKEDDEFITNTKLQKAGYKYEIQQQLKEIEKDLASEITKRLEIFRNKENVRKVADNYRSILAKGLRLLEERRAFNARVAAKVQGKRYQDMAFRLNINNALSMYKNAFDLASRYVYMTAKAYDYDTNLNERDQASALPLFSDIVRQRLLGQYKDGEYIIGRGGLGDIMARLKINYDVMKTRMGFNNPQTETGRFSLRKELFRVKKDSENDNIWRDELKKHYVENLWAVPEFRKFCRPFTQESSGSQPGLAIPFETNIIFGFNYFGWPLAGSDHAYDPTNFATKIRSVGLWFENYDNSQLSETPRAYLIPAGMDIMLVPNSTDMDHREWTIVDQKIPIPIPVGNSDFYNPNYIPSLDGVNGSLTQIRRYSSFRAYHDSGYFDENQVVYDSRLIGRSVWNTRWMLIIEGGTFHYDPKYGINTFIDTVSDIKLFFQTYAISGN